MAFRAVNNADFVVNSQVSSAAWTPLNRSLYRNFLRQAIIDTGFLAYADQISVAAGLGTSPQSMSTTTSRFLLASESGITFLLGTPTVGVQIVLPSPAAGLRYTFRLTAQSNGVGFYQLNAGAAFPRLYGNVFVATAITGKTFTAKQFFSTSPVAVNTAIGDHFSVYCDGTNWHVSAFSRALNCFIPT